MDGNNNYFENNLDALYKNNTYQPSQSHLHKDQVYLDNDQYQSNNVIVNDQDLYLSNSQLEDIVNVNIKVLGIGSGGSNSVNYMFKNNLKNVDLICVNTDIKHLRTMSVVKKVPLGLDTTKGYRAGMDPIIGKKAAEESKDKIVKILQNTNMLFLIASLGGGTGTGATPLIAQVAKNLGILTVAVVTLPFSFEGKTRMKNALESLQELEKYVDSTIIINNENLLHVSDPTCSITMDNSFMEINKMLHNVVKNITDSLVEEGTINPNLNDLKNIMKEPGITIMGLSEPNSYSNYQTTIMQAITSLQLKPEALQQVKGLLINISTGKDIPIQIINETIGELEKQVSIFNSEINVIWGHSYNNQINGKMIISLIATGLDNIDIINYLSLNESYNNILKESSHHQPNNNFVVRNQFIDSKLGKQQNTDSNSKQFVNISSTNFKDQRKEAVVNNLNFKKTKITLADLPYFKNGKNRDYTTDKYTNEYDIPAFVRKSTIQ